MTGSARNPLNRDEEAVWRNLARFFVVAPRLLDEDLQRATRLSLSEYTVLMNLAEAPGRQLRITELACRAYLSGSRMTRLVDKLAAEELVGKRRSDEDRRGMEVSLTAQGLTRLDEAYPVHLASVRNRIMDHVDQSALEDFGASIAVIVRALEDGPL